MLQRAQSANQIWADSDTRLQQRRKAGQEVKQGGDLENKKNRHTQGRNVNAKTTRQVQPMSPVRLAAATPLQVLLPAAVDPGCPTAATCIGRTTPAFAITTDILLRLMLFESGD